MKRFERTAKKTRIVTEAEFESMVPANVQRITRFRQSIFQKTFTGEL